MLQNGRIDARAEAPDGVPGSSPRVQDRETARLHYLDGLRGWAALSVLLFHTNWELFGRVVPALRSVRLLLDAQDGSLAVVIFFALSGFVLSRPHLARWEPQSIRRVCLGRYVRLTLPIAAASLLALILLSTGAMFNHEASAIVDRVDWLDRFFPFDASLLQWIRFSAFDVYFHYDLATSYNIFAWTMSYELIGSFWVFGTLALFGADVRGRILSGLAAVLFFTNVNGIYLAFVYGFLLANLHPLISSLAISRNAVGNVLGLLLLGFVAIFRIDHYSVGAVGLWGVCVVLAVLLSPLLRGFLSCRFSQWLGRISFPLYLVHGLVICTISSFLVVRLHDIGWSMPGIAALVVPVTIVLSLAVAQLFAPIEGLAIRSSHRFAKLFAVNGLKQLPHPSLSFIAEAKADD